MEKTMEPLEVYTFKAPAELREALRQVAFKISKPGNIVTSSSYIATILLSDPKIVAELKRLKAAKRRQRLDNQ